MSWWKWRSEYRDPRELRPVDGAVNVHEAEIEWISPGRPYHVMCLELHTENQCTIDACERAGWFLPLCPWFDLDFAASNSEETPNVCRHKGNPFKNDPWSCYPSGCPTRWLS